MNLFIASVLRWPNAGLTLCQETKCPEEGRARFVFACDKAIELRVNVRHPCWATAGFKLKVNGVRQADASAPGSYATVARRWRSGDTLEVSMPFSLRTEGFRDNSRRFAFLHGPLVLCADTAGVQVNDADYPAFLGDPGRPQASLEPLSSSPGSFGGAGQGLRLAESSMSRVTLEPLYRVHGNRKYEVYWNAFSPNEWQANEERRQALARRTVDRVLPGDEQNEREHRVQGEHTWPGENRWRHAVDGGWFSWELKVLPDRPQELRVKYWGGDTGGREFRLLVDGEELANQTLDNNRPGEFYEATYPLPEQLTQGKQKVTLKFQARPGKMAGGVFGCSVLTRVSPK